MGRTPVILIYDASCPFSAFYVRHIRLKKSAGPLSLINIREASDPARDALGRFDLKDGIVVCISGKYYHAEAALHVLAMLSSRHGAFGRINYLLFKTPMRAFWIYPVLRSARNLLIRMRQNARARKMRRRRKSG